MDTVSIGSHGRVRGFLVFSLILLVLLLGAVAVVTYLGNTPGGDVLTQDLSEPLGDVTTATIDINAGSGNLTIDWLTGGEPLLAGGMLQYLEKQGLPSRSVTAFNGKATFTLRTNGVQQPAGFRLPWEACNGATEWQIHLNPSVQSDITAHSDGGNLKLNLAGMIVTRLLADTGGGNMDLVLPDNATNLKVSAKTGAGNVTVEIGNGTTGSNTVNANSGMGNVIVRVPSGMAVLIHAPSGLGKGTVDPQFTKIDGNTYQSPDYDSAANKVEINVKSGAGNVSVNTK